MSEPVPDAAETGAKAARRRSAGDRADIPPETLAGLDAGRVAASTLAQCLAVDHSVLMASAVPDLARDALDELRALTDAGIKRRMVAAAAMLSRLSPGDIAALSEHRSDTVRGWVAFTVGALPDLALPERFQRIRPFAGDPHFAVREWAWMAVRPHIAADIEAAVELLEPWTAEGSANLRRFAVEASRPRGVWAVHIPALKRDPQLGLPLLEPLRADQARYVQDSVANWINDAAKERPAWAVDLCARWQAESPLPTTERIRRRATRSI